MRNNLRLVVNNPHNKIEEKQFFEKDELKIILDLYAKMVSEGSWKDYGLNISSQSKHDIYYCWFYINKYWIIKIDSETSKKSYQNST